MHNQPTFCGTYTRSPETKFGPALSVWFTGKLVFLPVTESVHAAYVYFELAELW